MKVVILFRRRDSFEGTRELFEWRQARKVDHIRLASEVGSSSSFGVCGADQRLTFVGVFFVFGGLGGGS